MRRGRHHSPGELTMQPLLFGNPKAPLYGAYHPALAKHAAPIGVVLCAPLGHEYMRTHRALRQLAAMLAKAGHHVLRFDYRGTGDSAGEAAVLRLADWITDTADAIEELQDMAGLRTTALVGLRAGALIAAAAAAGPARSVAQLVCWDPVTRGATYLDELRAVADGPWDGGDIIGAGGLALSAAMRSDLVALDAAACVPAATTRTLVIGSESKAEYAELAQAWSAAGTTTDAVIVPCAGNWDDMDRIGAQLLPQAILRAITDHLSDAGVTANA